MSSSRAPASSLHLKTNLDVALNEYRKNIGKDLLSHPLAVELQRCETVDGILAILQRQANTVEQSRSSNRGFMKWISSLVHTLHQISTILGDSVGLVRLGNPCVPTEAHSEVTIRHSHLRRRSLLELVFSSPSVSSESQFFVHLLMRDLTGGKGCDGEPRCSP